MEEILLKILTINLKVLSPYVFRFLSLFHYKDIEVFETKIRKATVRDPLWKNKTKQISETFKTGNKKQRPISYGMYLFFKSINKSHLLSEPMNDYDFEYLSSFYSEHLIGK